MPVFLICIVLSAFIFFIALEAPFFMNVHPKLSGTVAAVLCLGIIAAGIYFGFFR